MKNNKVVYKILIKVPVVNSLSGLLSDPSDPYGHYSAYMADALNLLKEELIRVLLTGNRMDKVRIKTITTDEFREHIKDAYVDNPLAFYTSMVAITLTYELEK